MPVVQKDPSELMNLGFLSIISPRDLELCSKLNLSLSKQSQKTFELNKKGPKALEDYFKCSKADTIIAGGPTVKRWTFYKSDDNDDVVKVHKAKGPESLSVDAITDWLREKLGFDGVVLAKEGNFILCRANE